MAVLRSFAYAAIFYPMTLFFVLFGIAVTPFGRAWTLRVVLGWTKVHHWLVEHLLRIRVRLEGHIPPGASLIAVKHQSMLETLEMVRLTDVPVIVIKRELADLPLFGWMTRRYGVIPVERSAGATALRAMVAAGRDAVASGRSVIIYPEGTRVRVGQAPELKSGFAALYRALGLPVVPVAVDTGRLWGRGPVHHSGSVTLRVGETIPPGLKREEIESRVHQAINAFELTPEARS